MELLTRTRVCVKRENTRNTQTSSDTLTNDAIQRVIRILPNSHAARQSVGLAIRKVGGAARNVVESAYEKFTEVKCVRVAAVLTPFRLFIK